MANSGLRSYRARFAGYAAVYTLIVLAVLVAANWLANRHNKSVDLTSNQRFTLSDQTRKLVAGLQRDVTVIYFDRQDGFQSARDLLGRYSEINRRFRATFVDPTRNPQEARKYGVRMVPTTILQSGDRREDVRALTEVELTSALARVIKTGVRTVCFTAGWGERQLDDPSEASYSGIKELLERNNYKTEVVNLAEQTQFPPACTIVVVAGPRKDLPAAAVDLLKKHVESGGRAAFLLEPPLSVDKDSVSENAALSSVIASWGVTLNKDQVLDVSGVGSLYGLGPEVALASRYGTHPISRDLKGIATAFSIARSLEVKPGGQVSVETIVSSSPNSVATTQLSGKAREIDPEKGEKKSFPLAAAGTYRTGQPNKEGRFFVAGSAEWIANSVLRSGGNRDLFLNAMNWLSSDEDLISIRPKDPSDSRLELNRSQMQLIFLVSQFLIPLTIIAIGVMVWWRRR
jgi:ABC-type uncharacterized transport system involved in gliding motility auxiliary subunit